MKRHEGILLGLILLLGIFLRTYNLDQLLYFTYDQGRDAFVIQEMLTEKPIRLIGPTTGLPGVFIGPFYYYLLLPGYFLSGGDPVGAAVYMALIASVAIPLLFFFVREMFNAKIALLAAFLFAILPGPVSFARFLFNPNPAAPFGILFFWMLYRAGTRSPWYWLPALFLLGLLMQLEIAIAIFYLPIAAVVALWAVVRRQSTPTHIVLGFLLFLGTFIPLILFDFRHGHIIRDSLITSFQDKSTHTSLQDVLGKRPKMYYDIFVQHLFRQGMIGIFGIIGMLGGVLAVWQLIRQRVFSPFSGVFLSLWFFVPFAFLMFYTGNYGFLSDYYFLPQFPAGIIFLSLTIWFVFKRSWRFQRERIPGVYIALPFVGILIAVAMTYHEVMLDPKQSGINIALQRATIGYVYAQSGQKKPFTSIFVPNGQTEHYDYLFNYETGKRNLPTPVNLPPEEIAAQPDFFLIYEPDPHSKERFRSWYAVATPSSALVEKRHFGIITIEKRQKNVIEEEK